MSTVPSVAPGTGRIAVVGASAAGLAAVETLRRSGWDGELTLVGDEPHLPYDRPPLSKQVLSGDWEPARTALRGSEQIDALGLDLRLGNRATGLDTGTRRLTLADGTVLECSGVVVATGTGARTLPGTGGLAGVHVLRTLDDALALREQLAAPGSRRLAIVGTGVLGVEAAAVARGLGHEAALIGPEAGLMEGALGSDVGALLADVHRDEGVELHTGQFVDGVESENGRATGVRLGDGTVVAAETVLVAIGSAPTVGWLDGAGLDVTDGLGCDEYCAAAPGVYAAGDIARWHHPVHGRSMRVEHRMNATEQGMAAARNLLAELDTERFGERRPFTPVPYFWSDQYALRLQAYGVLAGHDRVGLIHLEKAPLRAAALYERDGLATGALGIGLPPKQARALRALVAAPLPWDEALAGLRETVG